MLSNPGPEQRSNYLSLKALKPLRKFQGVGSEILKLRLAIQAFNDSRPGAKFPMKLNPLSTLVTRIEK
jgi:hypothetical protein